MLQQCFALVASEVQDRGALSQSEVMITRGRDRRKLQNLSRIYATLYRVTT
jgi:hypothetical protein